MAGFDRGISQSIAELVAREGYELVHMEFKRGSGRHFLRIYIDKPAGVTLADCQSVSEQVSTLLDIEDPIQHQYTLEVSSPGLNRPLVKEADYVRFIGRRVRLTTREPIAGRSHFRGRISAAGEGMIGLITDDRQEHSLAVQQIAKANLEIEI